MNTKTFELLEVDKIILELSELARSKAAKKRIASLKPMTDIILINRHQAETQEARAIADESGGVPLNGMIGLTGMMDKLSRGEILTVSELENLTVFISDASKMKRFMDDKASLAPNVSSYARSIDPLTEIYKNITRCIGYGKVTNQASSSLGKIRRKIEQLEDKIKLKLNHYMTDQHYQTMLTDPIVSQRNGHYVIPVKSEHKNNVAGYILDKSRSGGTFFVEPVAIRTLNETLTQLKIDEENEVFRILSQLTNDIMADFSALELNVEVMENYDFLFAKAKLGQRMNGIRVAISSDKSLNLVSARHPLLGISAVPLNIKMTNEIPNLMITGPNTGGKTVSMKTIGLLIIMNQMGLQIPAMTGTSLPIYEMILCDIGDGQDISQNLSTFSSHIINIISILEMANEKTMVILDEIGAGTDPSEGMGIGVAVLETLDEKGTTILASTHYGELKTYAKNAKRFVCGSMTFDLTSLQPKYQLDLGTTGESNALLIALRLGMTPELIGRAHEIAYQEKKDYQSFKRIWQSEVESTIATECVLESVPQKLIQSNRKSKYTAPRLSKFAVGDRVMIESLGQSGIVEALENAKGEIVVRINGKKIMINHKRLALYITKDELYPENYDLDIVFESKDNRKRKKAVGKGKKGIFSDVDQ